MSPSDQLLLLNNNIFFYICFPVFRFFFSFHLLNANFFGNHSLTLYSAQDGTN